MTHLWALTTLCLGPCLLPCQLAGKVRCGDGLRAYYPMQNRSPFSTLGASTPPLVEGRLLVHSSPRKTRASPSFCWGGTPGLKSRGHVDNWKTSGWSSGVRAGQPQPAHSQPPMYAKRAFTEHSDTHHLHIVYCCLQYNKQTCDRDHMAHKPKIFRT